MNLAAVVQSQSYGKSQVRVSRIDRVAGRHDFIDLNLTILLEGDFDAVYTDSSNRNVVATDSIKNTAYVLAQKYGVASAESFALCLSRHFLERYSHVSAVHVDCEETIWTRMALEGKPHPYAFSGGTSERNTCKVEATRAAARMRSGLKGLTVLKTTASAFTDFLRDEFTTLPDSADRIFATTIETSWPCVELGADWSRVRSAIKAAFIEVFANSFSPSVQRTLFEMGQAALAATPLVDEIKILMPNQHHLPFDASRFGLQGQNDVFVPTSEPYGRIEASIRRGA